MRRRQLWLVGMAIVALLAPWLGYVLYPWPYQAIFLQAGQRYHVSPYLLAGVARAESRFDPTARSHRGAIGLMQVLPETAAYLSGRPKTEIGADLERPRFSIAIGAQYVAELQGEFHSEVAAIAAYNGGDASVRAWIAHGIWRPGEPLRRIPYPETKAFVERVKRNARWYAFLYPGQLPRLDR